MSKHTPGPWHIAVMESPDDDIDVRAHMNTQIARLWLDDAPDYEWNDQQRANARLIAAAPEMLELLKKMKDATLDIQLAFLLQDADKLIAKAEGKS